MTEEQIKKSAEQANLEKELLIQEHERKKEEEKNNYKNSCVQIEYKKIIRNPDNYAGTKIVLKGTVADVVETNETDNTIYLKTEDGNIWRILYKRPAGTDRVLKEDTITVYGEFSGIIYSYTALLYGADTENIPEMRANYVDIEF